MPSGVCNDCGNTHYGPCATEQTLFIYTPSPNQNPNEVLIAGSWHKWQTSEKMTKQVKETGEIFFRIILTLLAGQYQYKFIVDGQWKHDPHLPIFTDDFGCNNFVKVFPKKMFIPVNEEGMIKISSGIIIEGLCVVGAWDNWHSETPMIKTYNQLKACEEYIAFIPVEVDKEYEFKFKLKKQYLIDQKYPTTSNSFNTLNNIIITYSADENHSVSSDKIDTPTKWRSYKKNHSGKEFSCKAFEWVRQNKQFQLPYDRVQGHNMCSIGDYIYIFGGKCRNEFYNSLTKINTQLSHACFEQALPNGRAFSNMVTYGNKLIIYGGHNKHILQDYYSFNTWEQKWMAIPHISGKYPQKKQKPSCVLYQMLLVFFGGYYCSPDFEYQVYFQEISVLDIENMKWIDTISINGDSPAGRFAHTASLIGSDMYIFGGMYNAIENLNFNDMWKINLSTVSELSWIQVKPKGKLPTQRHGHTMNAVHKYLIVFGGQDNYSNYLNDIAVFNIIDEQWAYPIISGDLPRPRYYHASAVINTDQIIIFGGKTKQTNKNQHLYVLKPSEFKIQLNIEEEENDE